MILDGLTIDEDAVKYNLNLSNESILSELIVTVLTKEGFERPKVHDKLRAHSQVARQSGIGLLEVVRSDPDLADLLTEGNFDVESYYESIREVSRKIVDDAVSEYKKTFPK
jgi:adenylosuccinate lyase